MKDSNQQQGSAWQGSKTLLCKEGATCSLLLYVRFSFVQWFFLPTPGSLPTFSPEKFPCGYHNYILNLPVICCSLLVRIYHTHRAIIQANPWLTLLLFLSFPALLLRKHLLLRVQPCRWLAPPLGQLQLALQGESCLCSGFYFHFGEIKPECFVTSMAHF